MLEPGDVILANLQFVDTFEVKKRPAVVLYEEMNNIVVAGITSNTNMKGVPITKKEGAVEESIVKINYIFTISSLMVLKKLFTLSKNKKKLIFSELNERLKGLNN